MIIKQTIHFKIRLLERSIDFDHVKAAIRSPDSERVFGGRFIVRKKVADKIIEVVFSKSFFNSKDLTYVLITAYYI